VIYFNRLANGEIWPRIEHGHLQMNAQQTRVSWFLVRPMSAQNRNACHLLPLAVPRIRLQHLAAVAPLLSLNPFGAEKTR
jgi:hypothetical protein